MLYSTMDSTSSFRDLCHCRVMIYAMSGHAENLPVKRRIRMWVGGRRCDARPLRLIAASAQGCAQGEQPQGDRVWRARCLSSGAKMHLASFFVSVFFLPLYLAQLAPMPIFGAKLDLCSSSVASLLTWHLPCSISADRRDP